jgi:hypothetical protein
MKADVALVSCVKMKDDRPMPAKDLYVSPWFRMARSYVERNAQAWFILSAKHGLVDPETVIEPYELTLNDMSADERHEWSMSVIRQIAEKELCGDTVMILAGKHYRQVLQGALYLRYRDVQVPMGGLQLGEQLSWLSKRMNDAGTTSLQQASR